MPNSKTSAGTRNRVRQFRQADGSHEQSQTLLKLQTLRRRIQLCRQLALECACKAETAENEGHRDDYLRIEKSWINLAHSYEFAAQLLTRGNVAADGLDIDAPLPSSRFH